MRWVSEPENTRRRNGTGKHFKESATKPAAFWSRRALKRVVLRPDHQCSMDYDYWLRIVQSGGVVEFHDEYLACSRYPQTKTQVRVFIENFQVSLRRLGFIHASWISQKYFCIREKPLLLVVDTFARTVQGCNY